MTDHLFGMVQDMIGKPSVSEEFDVAQMTSILLLLLSVSQVFSPSFRRFHFHTDLVMQLAEK